MFVLDGGSRFVIPRTEMTYPGHNPKLHRNAADPEKSPVDVVVADFEDACPYEFKGDASRKRAPTPNLKREGLAAQGGNNLEAIIADLEDILAAPERQRSIVRNELSEIVSKYGDDRRTEIIPADGANHGLSALPGMLVARYLGDSSEAARLWFADLWAILRPACCGRPAVTPRIWNT